MPKPSPLPRELSGRFFTTRDAHHADVAPKRLRARDLARPFHGVFAPVTTQLSFEDLCRALQLRLPDDAAISGSSAARLRGAPLPIELASEKRIHVTVPEGHRAIQVSGTIGHSARRRRDEVAILRGLRVSSPERMWCELAAELSLVELVMVGDYLVHWRYPLSSITELRAAVASHAGRRGLRTLRQAVELLDERAESPQESRLRVLMVLHGIEGFEANREIATSGGYRYRGDFVFERERVVVEYQGGHHLDTRQKRADMTRKSRLTADKWLVIEVNADDWSDEKELISRIRTALHNGRAG